MRVFPRFALAVLILVCIVPSAFATHVQADCPLSLVATNPGVTDFRLSPHGIFRSGSQVFALRGQTLTTYTVSQLGDLQVAREDFLGSMGARETGGGIAFSNDFLATSSEAGLEVFDLRGVRAGGNAPIFLSRTAGLHYRRLAASGSLLAALYPVSEQACAANSLTCPTAIDLYDVADPNNPVRLSTLSTAAGTEAYLVGYNDIAFNSGYLIATGVGGTVAYNVTNPSVPSVFATTTQPGTFLVSNGSNLIGVGNDKSILVYSFSTTAASGSRFYPWLHFTISPSLQIGRANPVVFHPQAAFDEAGAHLIAMADELDPQTLQPARTIAFDVFDLTVPQAEGSDPRNYENVTPISGDEVKYNPLAVGPNVYTIGDRSGLQVWGACGQMAGRIELAAVTQLFCGGAEIHGWVTGAQKIANVELFLDNGSLGTVPVGGIERIDVASPTPVLTWRVAVNLDATTKGDHVLRLVATDVLGNTRQVASMNAFFPGPGDNCTFRRRALVRH